MNWMRLFSAWSENYIGQKMCWLGNCSLKDDFERMNVSWKISSKEAFHPRGNTRDMEGLGRNQVWVVYEFSEISQQEIIGRVTSMKETYSFILMEIESKNAKCYQKGEFPSGCILHFKLLLCYLRICSEISLPPHLSTSVILLVTHSASSF